MELVTHVEEQAVLLLWPQVVYRGLNAGVSTIASEGQVGAVVAGGSEAVQMSVNIVDVEESNIKGLVVSASIPTATFRFKSVDLDTVVANDHGGIGGDQENDWEKEGSEPHGGPTEVEGRRRAGAKEERKANLGDLYLQMRAWDQLDHIE